MTNPYYGFDEDVSRICRALERIADSLDVLAGIKNKKDQRPTIIETDDQKPKALYVGYIVDEHYGGGTNDK